MNDDILKFNEKTYKDMIIIRSEAKITWRMRLSFIFGTRVDLKQTFYSEQDINLVEGNPGVFTVRTYWDDFKYWWNGPYPGGEYEERSLTYVSHQVVDMDESMVQRCIICGEIISDYSNAVCPTDQGPPKGFPSGTIYISDGNPKIMTTAIGSGENWRPCK